MASAKIPVVLCIDVEPDDFYIARGQPVPWRGFEAMHEFVSGFRSWAADATGSPACFSWFLRMDPQVGEVYGGADWAAKYYGPRLDDIQGFGDEIGLHVHAYRWDAGLDEWVLDHANQPWIERCVETGCAAFETAFGRTCRTFRFGDGWMNDETLRLLEDRGVRFDLTVETGRKGLPTWHVDKPFTGSLPDWTGVSLVPYHPSAEDLRKPDAAGRRRIWMIPISSDRHDGSAERPWSRLRRLFADRGKPYPRCPVLNMNLEPEFVCGVMDRLLTSLKNPYLALVVRSDVPIWPEQFRNFSRSLEHLASHPMARRMEFCTPARALQLLGLT